MTQFLIFFSFLVAISLAAFDTVKAPGAVFRGEGADLVQDISYSFENGASCTACETIVVVLKRIAKANESLFISMLTEICKLERFGDDACEGSIAREGPIVANALRAMEFGSNTSKLFCITFMGVCSYPEVTPYTIPFPKQAPLTPRPSLSDEPPIRIVHFSDIHVDRLYVPGSNSNCSTYICCRPYTASDAPGNNDSPAGPYGDHKCDVPVSLEMSMYRAIGDIGASFSIFTGDIIDHAIWNTTRTQNTLNINLAYSEMESLGQVYGTIGNHEADPVNSYQPAAVGSDSQWIYDIFSSVWSRWIGREAAAVEKVFGGYSTKHPGTGLRIISLNTNLYYIQNYWLYQKTLESDPSGQLFWLVTELQAAEDAGDRVYIIGHMPMGLRDAFHDYSNYFDQIVNRYSATIAAMFFGHTHEDEFEISYNSTNRTSTTASAISYIAPALTPNTGHPSFRVYDVDPVTFAVLDSTTYIASMDDPEFQSTGPIWKKYYSAREEYGPLVTPPLDAGAELSSAFWHNVTEVFERDHEAFTGYVERKRRGWEVSECSGKCWEKEVCQMRAARAEDNCVVPQPGFHYERLGTDGAEAFERGEDACGGSIVKDVLFSLAGRMDLIEVLVRTAMEVE